MLTLRTLAAGLAVAILAPAPAAAQFLTFPTPTSSYTSGSTLIAIPGANFSTATSVTDGTETVTLSTASTVRTVPSGGWATWNFPPAVETHTPKVLFVPGTTVTLTLSPPQSLLDRKSVV